MIDCAIGLKRCWIKIYQEHLEGQVFTLRINKSTVYLEKEQIQSVQAQGIYLIVTAGGKKNKFICQDQKQALEAVNKIF